MTKFCLKKQRDKCKSQALTNELLNKQFGFKTLNLNNLYFVLLTIKTN